MKKSTLLLSAVTAVAIVAGVAASKSREGHTIYVPWLDSNICEHVLTGKTLVAIDPRGAHATLVPGPCPDRYYIGDLPNN